MPEIVVKREAEGNAKEVMFNITYSGRKIVQDVVVVDDNGTAKTTFKTQSPRLWYPHFCGEQPLYFLMATLLQKTTTLDICRKHFGLRRVKVIQRRLNNVCGTSFYFDINIIPIFCGGSNWIPADTFILRITPQR